MSEEEKEAVEFLKGLKKLKIVLSCSFWSNGEFEFNTLQKEQFDIILNLIDRLQEELDKYKRLAEANLKDSQEFQDNMCKHRCIKNNEVLELKEEIVELQKENAKLRNTNEILYETGKQNAIQELLNENWVSKNKIRTKIKELEEIMKAICEKEDVEDYQCEEHYKIQVLKELLDE